MLTREGKTLLMSVALGSVTPISTWYLGIINSLGGLGNQTAVIDWTMAVQTQLFAEFTAVANSTRLVWTPQAYGDNRVMGYTRIPYTTQNGMQPWGTFITTNPTFGSLTGTLVSVDPIAAEPFHDVGFISAISWLTEN